MPLRILPSYVDADAERLTRNDYVLLVITFLLPYTDSGVWWILTGFIPPINTLGSSMVAFVLALYLFQYAARRHCRPYMRTLYWLIGLASAWTVIKFFESSLDYGFTEAITIFRRRYILLPTFMLCMSYISSMSRMRMERFAQLVLKWTVFLGILYFLQNIGLNIFQAERMYQSAGGVMVMRNIIGMPPVTPVILTFCYLSYLYRNTRWSAVMTILCLTIVFFSYTRNLIATSAIIIILSTICYTWKMGLRDNYKLIFYLILGLGLAFLIFPTSMQFWNNLIDSTVNSQLVKEEGTYAFRQHLIEKAITTAERHHVLWTGLGYVRDVAKGEYSLVLGSDTYVAPILWCEGIIGLILRCVPFVYLAAKAWKRFQLHYDNTCGMLALTIVTAILSQIPNYVQTDMIINFNFTLALLYMMYMYILKYEEETENA